MPPGVAYYYMNADTSSECDVSKLTTETCRMKCFSSYQYKVQHPTNLISNYPAEFSTTLTSVAILFSIKCAGERRKETSSLANVFEESLRKGRLKFSEQWIEILLGTPTEIIRLEPANSTNTSLILPIEVILITLKTIAVWVMSHRF